VPVVLDDEWFETIKSRMPELPLAKQQRFVDDFGLSDYDASVLTAERAMAEYFEDVVKAGADAKKVCNLLTQTGLKLAKDASKSFVDFGVAAADMAKLAKMSDEGTISSSATTTILEAMVADPQDPMALAEKLNLIQKNDAGEIEAIVDKVLAENPKAVEDAKEGKKAKASRGFLVGQVMKASKGQANPKIVQQLLAQKLG
jgi:aspartyl-tRNA(Asn)/glutamyl-tRNA(Gln) amidotransferase subunit B